LACFRFSRAKPCALTGRYEARSFQNQFSRLQELRRRFPAWRLTLITDQRVAPIYAADIEPDELLTIAPDAMKRLWRNPKEFWMWWRTLKQRRFDASLVSYDQSSSAHALAWLTGGKLRVGGAGLRIRLQGSLTQGVAWREGWSIAQWNWEIARALVLSLGQRDWPATPTPPDLSHLATGVSCDFNRVVIHAGSKWEHTRWPREHYVDLAGRLARTHEVLWVDAPMTRDAVLPQNVTRVASADIGALVKLVASAGLFIGNNSGPMHVANAAGTPLVVVTGPSDTAWDPEWHRNRTTVLRRSELPCQPCERVHFMPNGCLNREEPLACLRRWTVDTVEQECRRRLSSAQKSVQLT
jgi:ADP-heptose:LPS heptosyltransferase